MTFTRLLLAVAVLSVSTIAAAQPTTPFVMAGLGTLGGSVSQIVDVNDRGHVAGNSTLSGDSTSHAFFWTATTGMIDLGTLGGTQSETFDLNDIGHVLGRSTLPGDTVWHGFLWTASDGMVDLTEMIGADVVPGAFNNNGQFVGAIKVTQGFHWHAFSWTRSGGLIDLGTLGSSHGGAAAVNDRGQVVGTDLRDPSAFHAFSWTSAGGMVDIGALVTAARGFFTESYADSVTADGEILGHLFENGIRGRTFLWSPEDGVNIPESLVAGGESFPGDVNESGRIVGVSSTDGFWGNPHAFTWTRAEGTVDLGTLGGTASGASGVSEGGTIVGSSSVAGPGPYSTYHAFVWTSDQGMSDLGTLESSHNSDARFVNDLGQIFGSDYYSTITGNVTRAVLWTDVVSGTRILTDLVRSAPLELGLSNALITKLRSAVTKWQHDNNNAAANIFGAFIAQINAQRRRTLSDAQADAIVTVAAPIAFALGNEATRQ